MKLVVGTRKARGKSYPEIRAYLPKNEGRQLLKVSSEWVVEDVDPKGFASLATRCASSKSFTDSTRSGCGLDTRPVRTSFAFHGTRREWVEFKSMCKGRGLNVCHVLSSMVQMALKEYDRVLEPKPLVIVNYFTGVPRGRRNELASSVVKDGVV